MGAVKIQRDQVAGRVAWLSTSPVKGLRLQHHESVELTGTGIPGDRRFFLVGDDARLISATRLGPLLSATAQYFPGPGLLKLDLPDGEMVTATVERGPPEEVGFYGLSLEARPVKGPFADALSDLTGRKLRLMEAPRHRPGVDRGSIGALSILSTASLDDLRDRMGAPEPIDERRFRMNLGVDGLAPYEEDGWIDREVTVGEARIQVTGNVGRCAVTTRDPDSGEVDMDTLGALADYRRAVETTEALPFGVFARVLKSGTVSLGDPVSLAEA